jgi:hypothetical protein
MGHAKRIAARHALWTHLRAWAQGRAIRAAVPACLDWPAGATIEVVRLRTSLVVAALIACASAAATPASEPSWVVQSSPALPSGSLLNGIAAISSTDAWSVGVRGDAGLTWRSRTLVERWDGRSWRVVAATSPRPHASLAAIAATSANDLWAVGEYSLSEDFPFERTHPLVIRWNGSRWQREDLPPITGSVELLAVAAISPRDVWAVGTKYSSQYATSSTSVILHWDGRRWSWTAPHNGVLHAVASAPGGDLWAVGVTNDAPEQPFRSMFERRRNNQWSGFKGPPTSDASELLDIVFTSEADGWAVGTDNSALILKWNGKRWNRVASPDLVGFYSAFGAVTALRDGRAWAAGSICVHPPHHTPEEPNHGDWDCPSRPVASRWDGRRWWTTPMPRGLGRLFGVDAASPNTVWAVGYHLGSHDGPLILHWEG